MAQSIRIATCNVNGILGKWGTIEGLLNAQGIDVMAVSETWMLNEAVEQAQLPVRNLPSGPKRMEWRGHRAKEPEGQGSEAQTTAMQQRGAIRERRRNVHLVRTGRPSGGVGFLVADTKWKIWKAASIPTSVKPYCCCVKRGDMVMINIYCRPHNTRVRTSSSDERKGEEWQQRPWEEVNRELLRVVQDIVQDCLLENYTVILMGDMNVDLRCINLSTGAPISQDGTGRTTREEQLAGNRTIRREAISLTHWLKQCKLKDICFANGSEVENKPTRVEGRRLDYIFTTGDLYSRTHAVGEGIKEVSLGEDIGSDHLPVIAEINARAEEGQHGQSSRTLRKKRWRFPSHARERMEKFDKFQKSATKKLLRALGQDSGHEGSYHDLDVDTWMNGLKEAADELFGNPGVMRFSGNQHLCKQFYALRRQRKALMKKKAT